MLTSPVAERQSLLTHHRLRRAADGNVIIVPAVLDLRPNPVTNVTTLDERRGKSPR
jgi:hypothetical protein